MNSICKIIFFFKKAQKLLFLCFFIYIFTAVNIFYHYIRYTALTVKNIETSFIFLARL